MPEGQLQASTFARPAPVESSLLEPMPAATALEEQAASGFLAAVLEKAVQLAEALKSRVEAMPATRAATIDLNPPGLGPVQIQLSIELSDEMRATLASSSEKAAELLTRYVDQLKAILAEAGIELESPASGGPDAGTNPAESGASDGGEPNAGSGRAEAQAPSLRLQGQLQEATVAAFASTKASIRGAAAASSIAPQGRRGAADELSEKLAAVVRRLSSQARGGNGQARQSDLSATGWDARGQTKIEGLAPAPGLGRLAPAAGDLGESTAQFGTFEENSAPGREVQGPFSAFQTGAGAAHTPSPPSAVSAEAPKGGATETDSAFGQRLAGVVAKAAELAEELRSRVTARPATRQATIALNPPELGKVQIQVHLDASDRMHATLAAASAKAAELLAHHVDQLRSALAQAGIRFDQFTQTGSQPQTDAHGSGTGANSRGEESRGVSSGEDDGRAAPDPAEEQSGALRRSWILFGRPRRLDVVV